MNKTLAFRSLCTKSILPAVALVLAGTGGSAMADVNTAITILNAHLQPTYIPSLKTAPTIQKAKIADLLTAISLAIQEGLPVGTTANDIAVAALQADGAGKYRADKDKVSGQVIATAAAAAGISDDAAALAALTDAVFNVNSASSNAKAKLTATGQANAVIGAVKAAADPSVGDEVGNAVTTGFTGDLATLLANTVKGLGKTTTYAQGAVLSAYVNGTLAASTGSATASFIQGVADKVAATNIVGTGSLYGGLVANNPGGNFTTQTQIQNLLLGAINDKKLTKALGEIIAVSTGSADEAALSTSLNSATTVLTTKALITQGLLRAGTAANAAAIITNAGSIDPTKYGATLVTGTGSDLAKVDAIVDKLAGTVGTDQKKQTAFGIAIINALALATPDAAKVAARSIMDVAFGDPTSRVTFGQNTVGKLKSTAAAGYVAAAIVEDTPSADVARAVAVANALLPKGTKAGNDIVQQIASLTSIFPSKTERTTFSEGVLSANKKFAQNVAVGLSLSDPINADTYTVGAITHAGGSDTAATAKAATIAGAVANVIDVEQISAIAEKLGSVMSTTGNTGKTPNLAKPVKIATAGTVATNLAKAIQAKPGISLANRMDELGELGAALTKSLLGQSGSDSKGQAAEVKLITTIGSNILKALSKVPVLSVPNIPGNAVGNLVANTQTFKADLWEARDIAGSIAQTIFENGTLTADQKKALLGEISGSSHAPGALEKAFLKLSGKAGSNTALAVSAAFDAVLRGNGAAKFEDGADNRPIDRETDQKNG